MPVQEVVIHSASQDDFLAIRALPWGEGADDYYEGPSTRVELKCAGLHAETELPAYVADAERLGPLFHEIDREWRGWLGEKLAGDPTDAWLAVSAAHDGLGHVELGVHLADGWPMEKTWVARGTLTIDVGSAAAIALSLDQWLAAVWPEDKRWRLPAP